MNSSQGTKSLQIHLFAGHYQGKGVVFLCFEYNKEVFYFDSVKPSRRYAYISDVSLRKIKTPLDKILEDRYKGNIVNLRIGGSWGAGRKGKSQK